MISARRLIFILAVFGLGSCVATTDSGLPAANSADVTLYYNGDIITMDTALAEAEAIAVRSGTILAVGSLADVRKLAGPAAISKDLQGATLLPGFIDAHGHISFTALNIASANLSSPPVGQAASIADVLRLLGEHLAGSEGDGWVLGYGYDDSLLAEKRHPNRAELDSVSLDRPIMIRHVSGHFVSCNTPCLKLAGITADTADPAGGIIRRRADGEPDGVLEETAMGPVFAVLPTPSRAQRRTLYEQAQQYYASTGVTTVQDGAANTDDIDLLREMAADGRLSLDVVAYPYVDYAGDKLGDYPASTQYQGRFRVGGIKIVLDGSPQGKTAWLTEPYFHPPHGQGADYLGYPTLSDEQAQRYVDLAFEGNTQLLAHANGDAAADQLLAAVSRANARFGKADRRTVMIHAQTAREDQIGQMLEQGVIPSYFSAHTYYWGDWHRDSVFGEPRAARISPLRSSADAGLRYTTHNDTPVVPSDMMRLLWASVNRITRSGKVLGAAQSATVMEALRSMTIDAAYQYFEEDRKGSISVGKLADLVILDGNPLKTDPLKIKDLKILETIKEGVVVYTATD